MQTIEPVQRLLKLTPQLKLEYLNILDIRVLMIEQILGNQENELAILWDYMDQIIMLTNQNAPEEDSK